MAQGGILPPLTAECSIAFWFYVVMWRSPKLISSSEVGQGTDLTVEGGATLRVVAVALQVVGCQPDESGVVCGVVEGVICTRQCVVQIGASSSH